MKIICTVENLKTAIGAAERFTSRHITLPILSYLLLSAEQGRILISATNLEMGIKCEISGKIQKPGVAAIPAKALSQILQTIKDDNITLDSKQNQLLLHTQSSDITLIGLNPDDFPKIPEIKKENQLTVGASDFTFSLQQIIPAAATSDLKPELSGVLFAASPGVLTMATTDSYRLAEKILNQDTGAAEKNECIIPARTIQEVIRVISGSEGDIKISSGERQIVFEWGSTTIISRLIDGNFPPYKNLIPKTHEATIVVNRDDLLRKVRLASVFSTRLNDVTLQFSPNQLEVATINSETGQITSRLAAKVKGQAGVVMFNYRYLLDGLEAVGGENAVLNLNGSSGPALIQNTEDASFLYLIMPIRST